MARTVFIIFSLLIPSIILIQETTELAVPGNGSSSRIQENNTNTGAQPLSASEVIDDIALKFAYFDFSIFEPEFSALREIPSTEGLPRIKRTITTCNYTSQGRTSCIGCRQILLCSPFNIGAIKTCHGFLPYCNNGVCSRNQGSLCFDATTTSSPSTTSTSSITTSMSTQSSSTSVSTESSSTASG